MSPTGNRNWRNTPESVVAGAHTLVRCGADGVRLLGVVVDLTTLGIRETDAGLGGSGNDGGVPSESEPLVDIVIHELRQPLTSILLTAQAAVRTLDGSTESVDANEIRELLTEIIEADQRAGRVMERIRALTNHEPMRMEAIRPVDLVRDVLAITRQRTLTSDLLVESDVDPDMPTVFGDATQLQQVLVNLIVNACEAMDRAAGSDHRLRITATKQTPDSTMFSVSDTGAGISMQPLDRIFQPFTTSKPGSTGLGLAICRRVMAQHGGKIWAENNAGDGATFRVLLPTQSRHRHTSGAGADLVDATRPRVSQKAAATRAASRRLRDEVKIIRDRVETCRRRWAEQQQAWSGENTQPAAAACVSAPDDRNGTAMLNTDPFPGNSAHARPPIA